MSQPKACILSVSGAVLTPGERDLLTRANPFGVILMGRSTLGPDQVRALVDSIWTATGRPTLIFIDQEGGRVARLKAPNFPVFPAPLRYGDLYQRDREAGREAAWLGHRLIAAELAPMGIHANFAPVLDLLIPNAHSVVGDRSFGASPDVIAELGRAAIAGLRAGGVVGAIKHMPGHGRAMVDSHQSMPVVDADLARLRADFAPFKALSDAPIGLTAHLAYPVLDGLTAATHSHTIVHTIIRGEIGFDGLLVTDDLGMNALGGTLASRATRAFEAGCDIALHCSGFVKEPGVLLAEMSEVAEVSPQLSGKALARAEAAEQASLTVEDFDRGEGWRRLQALLAGGAPSA
jgi:beta-N-acetylhexosaminidase